MLGVCLFCWVSCSVCPGGVRVSLSSWVSGQSVLLGVILSLFLCNPGQFVLVVLGQPVLLGVPLSLFLWTQGQPVLVGIRSVCHAGCHTQSVLMDSGSVCPRGYQVSLFLWSPGQCTRVGIRSFNSCELSGQSVLVDIVCLCGYHSSLWLLFQPVLVGIIPVCLCGYHSSLSLWVSFQTVFVSIIPVCLCGYRSSLSLWVSFQSVFVDIMSVCSSKPFCPVNIRSVCCYEFQVGFHIVLDIRSAYFCGSGVFSGLSLNIINYVSLPTCILGVLLRNYDYTSLICTAG